MRWPTPPNLLGGFLAVQKLVEHTKNCSRVACVLLAVMMTLVVAAGCQSQGQSSDQGNGEKKSVTLSVTHRDGSTKEFSIETTQEMLGAALQDEKLEGEDGQYGLFITTVDGEKADDGAQEWWCLTKGGEQVNTGIDSTPVEDGATYELVLTTGY